MRGPVLAESLSHQAEGTSERAHSTPWAARTASATGAGTRRCVAAAKPPRWAILRRPVPEARPRPRSGPAPKLVARRPRLDATCRLDWMENREAIREIDDQDEYDRGGDQRRERTIALDPPDEPGSRCGRRRADRPAVEESLQVVGHLESRIDSGAPARVPSAFRMIVSRLRGIVGSKCGVEGAWSPRSAASRRARSVLGEGGNADEQLIEGQAEAIDVATDARLAAKAFGCQVSQGAEPFSGGCQGGSPRSLASPKSVNQSLPSWSSTKLDGFTSRWRTPWPCAYASDSAA